MIETIILCGLFGLFIILAFTIGLAFGTKIKNNEKIEIVNPIANVKEKKALKKQAAKIAKAAEIEEINLANIDAYDGTSSGQKDFPR